MGYTKGQAVKLSGAYLYVSSTASSRSGKVTGTYYIWSASVINGRIRITNRSSYVGKTPAGTYVTGWINTSAIPSAAKPASTSGSNTKSSIEIRYIDPSTITAYIVPTPKITTVNSDVAASDVTPTGKAPGQIGYLGKVLFIVAAGQIKTIQNFSWETSVEYAEHDRHLRGQMLEFTGVNAGTIKFDITLSAYLGTAPMTDYMKLESYMENGTAIPLRIGTKTYGHYRWVIEKLSMEGQYTDAAGDWTQIKVTVSLREYTKR